jgi:hypothetical protein
MFEPKFVINRLYRTSNLPLTLDNIWWGSVEDMEDDIKMADMAWAM